MVLFACVDKETGQSFNHRRQSADRNLIKHMLTQLQDGQRILISPYSQSYVSDFAAPGVAVASQSYLSDCGEGDACFVETDDAKPVLDKADTVILYRWDKEYPADMRFPELTAADGWRLTETYCIQGHSHECIAVEKYERKIKRSTTHLPRQVGL